MSIKLHQRESLAGPVTARKGCTVIDQILISHAKYELEKKEMHVLFMPIVARKVLVVIVIRWVFATFA